MTSVAVRGIGFTAPGLVGWDAARACLAGGAAYTPGPLPKLVPEWLPANERRRLSRVMRLALSTGQEAVHAAGVDPAGIATVFTSANGDGDIVHAICEELARPEPAVSPTQFHNSVHNAPAGYWSIAARSQAPSSAVAAHDASFAAGLVEAATLADETDKPVLLVAYDHPLPFPLGKTRPMDAPFACALLLAPDGAKPAVHLVPDATERIPESRIADPALEALRSANPAARALPLLALLARAESGRVTLPWVAGNTLSLELVCA